MLRDCRGPGVTEAWRQRGPDRGKSQLTEALTDIFLQWTEATLLFSVVLNNKGNHFFKLLDELIKHLP